MTIQAFDHFTLRCADLQASWRFYEQVLGLRVTPRPGISIPAAIVYVDETDETMLIHLFQAGPELEAIFARLQAPDAEAAEWGTRRLHHVAFRASGLAELRARLRQHGRAFTERTLPTQSKHLLLLKDPDDVEIELAFPLHELDAAG